MQSLFCGNEIEFTSPVAWAAGENEENVRYLLDAYPFMRLVHHSPRLGQPGLTQPWDWEAYCRVAGSGSTAGSTSGAWLTAEEAAMVQRFDPSADEDTIGFFIAKFMKRD